MKEDFFFQFYYWNYQLLKFLTSQTKGKKKNNQANWTESTEKTGWNKWTESSNIHTWKQEQ